MNRRKFLAMSGVGAAATLAGCLPDTETVDELPRPVKGDPESDVVLRVFEDLGCPACRNYTLNVEPSVESEYINEELIRYEFYDYVLPASRWSETLANAARGVQDRLGIDEFWSFTRQMFEQQNEMSLDIMQTAAEDLGVEDVDVFINDAEAGVYEPVIQNDIDFGNSEYNVSATPTLVLNDNVLSSAAGSDFEILSSAIESELQN